MKINATDKREALCVVRTLLLSKRGTEYTGHQHVCWDGSSVLTINGRAQRGLEEWVAGGWKVDVLCEDSLDDFTHLWGAA